LEALLMSIVFFTVSYNFVVETVISIITFTISHCLVVEEVISIHSLISMRPKFCKHCLALVFCRGVQANGSLPGADMRHHPLNNEVSIFLLLFYPFSIFSQIFRISSVHFLLVFFSFHFYLKHYHKFGPGRASIQLK